MKTIILPDEQVTGLEKMFGEKVRLMGAWNSDGVYGYLSIPIICIHRAAKALNIPHLMDHVLQVNQEAENGKPELFCKLLDQYGSILIEQITIAYRDLSSPVVDWQMPERAFSAAH